MRNKSAYFAIFLIPGLLIFIDAYVFQGVKTLATGLPAHLQLVLHVSYWVFSAFLLVGLLYALFAGRKEGKFNSFSRVIFHTFLVLTVTKVVFLLVLFTEDIYRGAIAMIHFIVPAGNDHILAFPHRMKVISGLGAMLAGIPFVSFIYGIAKGKYDYKVHRHVLYFEDLPEAFDGFTITQISDIHAGSLRNVAAVRRGIELIQAQGSDLFVFTGDLVNNVAAEIEPWLQHFQHIQAPFGKFSILGNHDYGDYVGWQSAAEKSQNLQLLKKHHETLGHRLLLDEHIVLEKEGQQLVLLGVENWGRGFGERGDLEKALRGVDPAAFKILLSHDPSHWDAQVKDHDTTIHLTLSGHTHGMQVGIEVPGIKWSPVKYRYPHWAGILSRNGRYLNVNRGFGFIGFEGRVGIWPEVTVIELRKAED